MGANKKRKHVVLSDNQTYGCPDEYPGANNGGYCSYAWTLCFREPHLAKWRCAESSKAPLSRHLHPRWPMRRHHDAAHMTSNVTSITIGLQHAQSKILASIFCISTSVSRDRRSISFPSSFLNSPLISVEVYNHGYWNLVSGRTIFTRVRTGRRRMRELANTIANVCNLRFS